MKDDIKKVPKPTPETNTLVAKQGVTSVESEKNTAIDPLVTKNTSGKTKTQEAGKKTTSGAESGQLDKRTQNSPEQKNKNKSNAPTVAIIFAIVIFIGLAGLAVFAQIK